MKIPQSKIKNPCAEYHHLHNPFRKITHLNVMDVIAKTGGKFVIKVK